MTTMTGQTDLSFMFLFTLTPIHMYPRRAAAPYVGERLGVRVMASGGGPGAWSESSERRAEHRVGAAVSLASVR